jgi:ABC-2 type transport system ATP-binding protein
LLGERVPDVQLLSWEPDIVAFELENVSASRGKREVLHAIDLGCEMGVVGILGVNGAGKSSLLAVMSGILAPRAGFVSLDGARLYNGRHRSEGVARRLALVPQEFDFPARFTVAEFLHYFAFLRKVPRREVDAALERVLRQVDLAGAAKEPLSALSGGMRRRAMIAQALLAEPDVLLLDEATTGLDPVQRAQIRRLLSELGRSRVVVLASHIIEDIEQTSDHIVVLDRGRAVFDGTKLDLCSASGDGTLEGGFLAVVGTVESDA